MATFKYVGAPFPTAACYLKDSRPDGYEFEIGGRDQWFRLVRSSAAGPGYDGYAVRVDLPDRDVEADTVGPDAVGYDVAEVPTTPRVKVCVDSGSFQGGSVDVVEAAGFVVLDEMLYLHDGNGKDVAVYRDWVSVRRLP